MPSTKRTATANPDPNPDMAECQRAFKRMQTEHRRVLAQMEALCHKVVALRNEVRALKRENASIPVATPVAETSSSSCSPGHTASPPVPCVIDVDVDVDPQHTECNSVGGASSASCCTVPAPDTHLSE